MLSTTASGGPLQSIVTLDLEGVLVPEIWIAVAEKTGIAQGHRERFSGAGVWGHDR